MNLSRTRGGQMIHRRDCEYAKTGKPWLWAENVSQLDVIVAVATFGYDTCRRCRPLDAR